ncbi:MAG: glycoside hydrolase family 13 protein [Bacteroidia bacterium]|nr:glycoside hydrolase family 13 protein [Bacteroidia bacterium]
MRYRPLAKTFTACLLLLWLVPGLCQKIRVEPPNWWVGMKDANLQLMVHSQGIGDYSVHIDSQEVELTEVSKGDSPNYLFLDLIINSTSATEVSLVFTHEDNEIIVPYTLNERAIEPEQLDGFDSSDVIYLITPDRFANGDPKNDVHEGMKEIGLDRTDDYARHGGDIQGITKHLDYISDMGFTAIWSSPLLENNMVEQSYHGYAITDYYKVDPRFGTLESYKELSSEAAKRGIKLIMDQVANHCGLGHWWMADLPFDNWINDQDNYQQGQQVLQTNHRRTTNQDMYASQEDKKRMSGGWFVSAMPDLNQNNSLLATYIIQNSIWWIETLGLGGIRQDTYPYPEKDFMANWAKRIMKEYPNFSIVGEEWSYNPLLISYWQQGNSNKDGYDSYLTSTMDFPLQKALIEAIKEEENWNSGLIKLYEGLANDFAYPDPKSIMIFGDNHDMDRIYTQLGEDPVATKMALSFILVSPRIPQIYYGTEILLSNTVKRGDHGLIRSDFPGGWANDTINAFEEINLTPGQLAMKTFLRKLLNFRKSSEAIHMGKTIHFSPQSGIYTLFRFIEDEMIMFILNKNKRPVSLALQRFEELDIIGANARNIISGEELILGDEFQLEARGPILLSLTKKTNE